MLHQIVFLTVENILNLIQHINKSKNKITDDEINGIKLRLQNVEGLPPKELRKLVDKGKKDLIYQIQRQYLCR